MRFVFSCPKGAGKKSERERQGLGGTNPGEEAVLKINDLDFRCKHDPWTSAGL